MEKLSHFTDAGKIKMVDISDKNVTIRRAVASGRVVLSAATIEILRTQTIPRATR
jgi:cyclic pyranopterin phosphate synthase